jgi:PST family polysaccharide transporter
LRLKIFSFPLNTYFTIPDVKKLFFNFISYGSYQVITYLSHLITIPYIVRVVGKANFGILSLALALVSYMAIISEYGFSISGVQYIAQNQQNRSKRTEVVANVFGLQILLMLCSFLLLLLLVTLIPKFQPYKSIFFFTFLIIPANITMALWFYIGMEKIKYLSFIVLVSKALYILSVFIFVKTEGDFYYVPLLNGFSAIVAGLFSLSILLYKFKLYPIYLTSIRILYYIKNNWNIFLSILSINIYRNSNVLILGLLATVGIYSGGEKIVIVIQSIFAPITQAVYPYISRLKVMQPLKSKSTLVIVTLLIGGATFLVSLILFIFSDKIALLVLGKDFIQSGFVIRISSLVVFFGPLNFIMGIIFMTNYGMKNEFKKAVLITGILNIIICFILSSLWKEIGTAFSFLTAEFILSVLLFYFINRKYKNFIKNLFQK